MKRIIALALCLAVALAPMAQVRAAAYKDLEAGDDFIATPTPAADEETDLLKITSSGDAVLFMQMRLRDLGYYNYKINGYFGAITEEAVRIFQEVNGLAPDGMVGAATSKVLYSNQCKRKPINIATRVTPTPKPTPKKEARVIKMYDWFSVVQHLFPRGGQATVIDVYTGISYRVQRVGGRSHADVEPVTANDTKKFKQTYGGSWDWARRPVWVVINGEYIAGSTNGMPHGYETVGGNNMTGQVCIHFLNSRTHIREMKDPQHQAMVRRAAGQ